MLAVFAPLEDVSACSSDQDLDLVIANKNAPRQCVLSGRVAEIERAPAVLGDRQIATHIVPVSAAFHSRPWPVPRTRSRQTLDSIDLHRRRSRLRQHDGRCPTRPTLSRLVLCWPASSPGRSSSSPRSKRCTDGGADVSRSRPRRQAHRAWFARSSKAPIISPWPWIASRGAAGNLHDLACSLASLAALGYAVDLDSMGRRRSRVPAEQKPGFTVKICGANARPKAPPPTISRPSPAAGPEREYAKPKPRPLAEHAIARAGSQDATMPSHPQPPDHAETRSDHDTARQDQLHITPTARRPRTSGPAMTRRDRRRARPSAAAADQPRAAAALSRRSRTPRTI